MDLTTRLLRLTPPRPFVVAGPGGTEARLTTERTIRERGWHPALTPAEANILIITGTGLDTYVERIWQAMPAPRTRLTVSTTSDIPRHLDTAVTELHNPTPHRDHADGEHGNREHKTHDTHTDNNHSTHSHDTDSDHNPHSGHSDGSHGAHGGHAGGGPDTHGGHSSHGGGAGGGHDPHGGHGSHGHHMGGMDMPGGVPMADRAEDRDGLMLDVLHVPLGPVLPLWPAGLIVHTRLQGDVVQQAGVEIVDAADSFWVAAERVRARRLDSSARLLALAGWTDAAMVAQRLRDEALDGTPSDAGLRKWVRRVRRSRTLRWLLAGVGTTADGPPALAGDALARLHSWLDQALEPGPPDSPHDTEWIVDNLPSLLAGTELATARLVVASLDPDLGLLARVRHG